MISDYVKGKKKFDYPERIQAGIVFHRLIDSFTDIHPATKEAKEVFRPHYRLYSGAFVDVVYDHFLATDHSVFITEASLAAFTQRTYSTLDKKKEWFPLPFAQFFPFMRSQDWLYHYRVPEGTEKSLGGVVRRSAYLTESKTAYHLFKTHYQLFSDCYRQFWADMLPFARQQYEGLLR
jgi:acyl carrier protein phosphodiesterase